MLIIKNGDVLRATENIICHQVNIDGNMGGGVALQIAKKYPEVNKKYIEFVQRGCHITEPLQILKAKKEKYIANCFTQKQNYDTDYNMVKEVFMDIKKHAQRSGLSICMPYMYGCGIANGDWNIVEGILLDIFDDYDITVYRFKKEIN